MPERNNFRTDYLEYLKARLRKEIIISRLDDGVYAHIKFSVACILADPSPEYKIGRGDSGYTAFLAMLGIDPSQNPHT